MKSSIKTINEWLIVIMVFIGLTFSFSFINSRVDVMPKDLHNLFNPYPTVNFLSVEVIDAINIFSGDEPEGFHFNLITMSVLFNVVLFLMIGPYLMYLGYKYGKSDKLKPWYWFLGAVICVGTFSIVPVEFISIRVFQNTKASAEESRIRDQMRAELADVGFAVAEYEILEDGIDDSFLIEDLNMENLEFEYTVENISSDTLISISVSNPEIPDFNVGMEVRPYNKNLMIQRN